MKSSQFLVFFVAISLAPPLLAGPIRQPSDLEVGDEYRLVFITSGKRDATSSDIADYDSFVQATADAAPEVGGWGLTWQVLGSTDSVDARNHTDTLPIGPIYPIREDSVRIYQLQGPVVAESYGIFWSPADIGSKGDDGFLVTEFGETLPFPDPAGVHVWTGTNVDGTARRQTGPLGAHPGVAAGIANHGAPSWFSGSLLHPQELHHLYAISEVLTAVPEPSSYALVLLAALGMLFVRDKRTDAGVLIRQRQFSPDRSVRLAPMGTNRECRGSM